MRSHEKRLGARLRAALPGISVYLSSEVLPEIREFERTSTTAVCAYVGPILASYLERLEGATRGQGLPRLYVMGSNGGILEAAETVAMPAMAVESGPAAGVVAAALVARQTGHLDLLSFDMGGTTAKASLIRDGQYETTPEYEVGGGASGNRWMHGTGHPIRVPVIDLAEVSAGGGSIAWVDRAGSLRVGPKSAGAEPGPVCYGRGGREPTVTDCNLLLGYLDKGSLLAGDLPIDHAAAEAAVAERLAKPLGVDARTAAAAVIDVVNHAMAEALKIVSVQRGHDPRAFVLAAFGGAGPLHAAALSDELGIGHVICPPIPGAFSALGLVGSDLQARLRAHRLHHHRHGRRRRPRGRVRRVGARRRRHAGSRRRDAGAPPLRAQHRRRYERQSYELAVPVAGKVLDAAALAGVAEAFHDRHRLTYGHDNRGEPVQLVSVRVTAIGAIPTLTISTSPAAAGDAADAIKAAAAGLVPRHWAPRRPPSTIAGTCRPALLAPGPAVIEVARSPPFSSPRPGRPEWTTSGFVHLTRAPSPRCGERVRAREFAWRTARRAGGQIEIGTRQT